MDEKYREGLWAKLSWRRLVECQEPLGEPFDPILHDNLESLYVETGSPARRKVELKRKAEMTTQNAMMERRSAEEMAKLRAERDELDRQARVIARPYVAEERDACAKICDDLANRFIKEGGPNTRAACFIAAGIRTAIMKRGES